MVQPLGTNAEREIETQGMAHAIMDFEEQMGIRSEAADKLLSIRKIWKKLKRLRRLI